MLAFKSARQSFRSNYFTFFLSFLIMIFFFSAHFQNFDFPPSIADRLSCRPIFSIVVRCAFGRMCSSSAGRPFIRIRLQRESVSWNLVSIFEHLSAPNHIRMTRVMSNRSSHYIAKNFFVTSNAKICQSHSLSTQIRGDVEVSWVGLVCHKDDDVSSTWIAI